MVRRAWVKALGLSLVSLLFSACAKIADPRPPVPLVPRRTDKLSGYQLGDQVVLTWPQPAQNTDGSAVTTLKRIDVYRLVEPRRGAPTQMSSQEFASLAQLIKSIGVAELKDYTVDGHMRFRDALAFDDRSIIFQHSFRYAIKFVNDKNQDAGFSNFFFISPVPLPPPPENVSIAYDENWVELRWLAPEKNADGSRPPRLIGYNVFRSEDPGKFPARPLNDKPITENIFRDRDFEFGKRYYYAVSIVAGAEPHYAESLPSKFFEVTPLDRFPPRPPEDVTAFSEPGGINLVWAANPERDIAGYNVYRSTSSGRGYAKLNGEPIPIASFKDTRVEAGRQYFYVVTAVDKSGNESAPSREVTETGR